MAEIDLGRYAGLVPKGKGAKPTASASTTSPVLNKYEALIPANKKATEQPAPDLGRFASLVPPKPTPVVKPTMKQKFDSGYNSVMNFIDSLTARPDYEKKPASTNKYKNAIRELPAAITETILPGVKAIRDNESEFARENISNMDMLREVPTVLKQTGQAIVSAPVRGAIEAPAFLTGGKYDPSISFKIPGLGEINNSTFRIGERVAQGEDPVSVVIAEKSTGLLDALFFASIVKSAFVPRPTVVASGVKSPTNQIGTPQGPKSFRLYQGEKPITTPLPKYVMQKLVDDGVKFKRAVDPNLPTYFVQRNNGTIIKGDIVQVRPSYFDKLTGKTVKPVEEVIHTQQVPVKALETIKPTKAEPPMPAPAPKPMPVTPPIAPPAPIAPTVATPAPVAPEPTPAPVPAPVVETPVKSDVETPTNLGRYEVLVPKAKVSQKEIENLEGQMTVIYTGAPPEKVSQAVSEILAELEISEAGSRYKNQDGTIVASPSTFPKWIPEELRSRELFNKVLKNLTSENFTFPKGNRSKQRALYNVLFDEIDSRVGVDTAEFRKQIIELYGTTKEAKDSEGDSGSPARSKRGGDITVDDILGGEATGKKPREGATYDEVIDFYRENPQSIDDFIKDYRENYGYLSHRGFASYADVNAPTKNVDREKAIKEYESRYPDEDDEAPKKKTQKEAVKETVAKEAKSIKQIASETGIKEPNIRRILGTGAKEGTFERVDDGVYILNNGKEDIAYIHTGSAIEALPRLAKEGLKVDMVFLDIPYDTPAVKGGNRGVDYNLISVEDFKKVMKAISSIVKSDDTPVYYMFSRAESGLKKMLKYNDVLSDEGFKVIAEGNWQKLFKTGAPVTNVRGEVAKPEGILLLNKSGTFTEKDKERALDFTTVRPKGYQTEKPAELLNSIILQGTKKGDTILDPFAGSGVSGAEAIKTGRKAVLIEKNPEVVEKITKPRFRKAIVEIAKLESSEPLQGGKSVTKGPIKVLQDVDSGRMVIEDGHHRVAEARKAGKKTIEAEIDFFEEGPDGEALITDRVYEEKTPAKGSSVNASIGTYRDGTSIDMGQIDKVKPIELPEMVQLAKDLMGQVPKIRIQASRAFGGQARGVFRGKGGGEITLRADLFDPKISSIDQAAKTLAHEIGHLIDYLPDHTLARGNLLGRLSTLRKFMDDFYEQAGITRSNVDLKAELWNFSKYWKPIDESKASAGFLKYRKSGKEVYADFISGLFNDPAKVGDMAPASYNAFFQMLDRKPIVKDAYFELQAMLHGERESIIKVRREGVKEMFKTGDMKSVDYEKRLQLEREDRKKNSFSAIRFNLVDNNTPMIDRVKNLEKQGTIINMDEDPRYLLEERNYISGLVKSHIEKKVVPVYDDLKSNEISWDTFGEALFYDRIVSGDRSAQANPRGITPDAAKELYADLKKESGDKWPIIEKNMEAFRAWLKEVATEAFNEGLYSPELFAQMQENPAYVTFRVLEHIEDGVSSKVYKSIGTLKDITNPADASILKTIATIRSIERNKTIKTSVDFLKNYYPEDISEAKSSFNGKAMQFKESKRRDQELVIFKRNGKAEGYYVDPYIKHSLENDTIGRNNALMKLVSPVSFMNRHLFRPLFIGYNPGFQAFNLIRDFSRFWKNTPNMTLAKAFARYIQAMPVAKVRAFGISENPTQLGLKAQKLMEDLEAAKVFGTTFTDYAIGKDAEETQIEIILRNTGIDTFAPEAKNTALNKLLFPFVKALDLMRKTGNFIETLPKAAGVYHLTGGDVSKLTAEQRSFVRKNIGSPDFLTRGYASPVTNELFLFSNSIIQGMRSDIQIATAPKSRSGYWWKSAKLTLLPKILMFMASIGLMGKEIKELMDNASEYDKANYTVIPFGKDETGKPVYIRIPQDESGRLVGALLWKTLGTFDNTKPKQELGRQLSDIFGFLGGQVPSITPTVSTAHDIFTYMSGRNPYDSFRGRLVLSKTLFDANNWETDKAFIGYVFNQLGGGIFYRFNASGQPSEKGPLEELVNLPIVSNVVGRFIRVSDYGITETLNVVKARETQESARETLENQKLVDKYVEQALAIEDLDYSKRRELELALVEEKFEGKPKTPEEIEKANSLIKKLRVSLVKGISGPEVDSLTTATSNDMKLELLKAIRTRMSDEDFESLKETVIKERIVSSEVFRKLQNEE